MELPEHCCEVLGGRKTFKKDKRKLRPEVQVTSAETNKRIRKALGGEKPAGSYQKQRLREERKPVAKRRWSSEKGWY